MRQEEKWKKEKREHEKKIGCRAEAKKEQDRHYHFKIYSLYTFQNIFENTPARFSNYLFIYTPFLFQHFAARLIFLQFDSDQVTPLLKNPNSSSPLGKSSSISLASYFRPSIIWPRTSSLTLPCTSSLYTSFAPAKIYSLMPPAPILCFPALHLCLPWSLCLECLSWYLRKSHMPDLSRLRLEDAGLQAGTRLSAVDPATFTHVLYTHRVTGPSEEEEVSSYCGPGDTGLCPLPAALPAAPRLPLTQKRRWLINQRQRSVAKIAFKGEKVHLPILRELDIACPVPTHSFTGEPLARCCEAGRHTSWFQGQRPQKSRGPEWDSWYPRCPSALPAWRHHEHRHRRKITIVNVSSSSPPWNSKNRPKGFLKVAFLTKSLRAGFFHSPYNL